MFCHFHIQADINIFKFLQISKAEKKRPGSVFTNIPIFVLVLTLVVYHFNHMPDFISITVSTILALKSSCRINILSNYTLNLIID